MILQARDGSGARLTARIVPGRPVRLVLDDNKHATSRNIAGLLEY